MSQVRPTPKPCSPCPQLPGTLIRIFIPAGAVINLLNIIELTSPSGICLIIRLPFLGTTGSSKPLFNTLAQAIQSAGGKFEFVQE
ncbi:hypothetical protein [Alkaliphilus transvaalensis]|uniref:hypothetical protein n=1 Tax=Alkaliphilus transvaalensis TaxID=114628 RepID=UPI000AD8B7F1|nr:hypothetical protein [Alkaliphilus transvaalensis]